MRMRDFIEKVVGRHDLTKEESSTALGLIMDGECSDVEIAALVVALRTKGEAPSEIAGFVQAMKARCVRIRVEDPLALDIVGTGGDGLGTFNISTAAMFIIAGAGVTIAKHGNKAVSSSSGSADVLSALGVDIHLDPATVESCINSIGIGFLFAPVFHPAMKSAAGARSQLGIRTIFNLIGPLSNPAGVRRQLIGTYNATIASLLSNAIDMADHDRVVVVTADGGLDEVSLAGKTVMIDRERGSPVRTTTVTSESFALPVHPISSIRGGSSEENAVIIKRILEGEPGPFLDYALANAALGVYVSGRSTDIREARDVAEESVRSGRAKKSLQRLVEYTTSATNVRVRHPV